MKNVIVLFGGDSDEKEISKLSADSIINNIDTTKFDAQLLDLNNLNLIEVDKDTVFLSPFMDLVVRMGKFRICCRKMDIDLQVQTMNLQKSAGIRFYQRDSYPKQY